MPFIIFIYYQWINYLPKPEIRFQEIIQQNNTSQLDIFNKNKSKIKNINYKSVKISSHLLTLTGYLRYEKDHSFRLFANWRGPEIDVGSNQDIFWFWSKRPSPRVVYFSKHEDIEKTRLKTPLRPDWLKQMLDIDEINPKKYTIGNYHGKFVVLEETKTILNESIYKLFLLNPKSIDSIYLIDHNLNTIASCHIQETYEIDEFVLPKKIQMNWYDENLSLLWEFEQPEINTKLDKENWVMPHKPIEQNIGF